MWQGTPRSPSSTEGRNTKSERGPLAYPACARPVVFVVDDDASVRESLMLVIDSAGWHGEAFASAEAFLARPKPLAASCAVLDVQLPDLNGLDLQERMADERLDMPIIFVTGHADVSMTVRAMKRGAVDFLVKPLRKDALLDAIADALERSRIELEHKAELATLGELYASLTPREREVMGLVVAGRLNKQVGSELGISEITVKAHRGNVMRKMNAGSLADLVATAVKLDVRPAQRA
jgi:FixJ family two-component response regulator